MTTTDAPATLDEARDQADAIAPPAPPVDPDAKPRRTRAPRKRPPRARADAKPRTSKRAAPLRAQLEEAITGVGLIVFVVNQVDGRLIMQGAQRQAAALDALAKENPAVRVALERLLRTSVYAGLAMAFAPTLLGIAANHGIVPPMVGALAGMATPATSSPATSSPASGADVPADPLAGVDLTDLAKLGALFSSPASAGDPEGGDGVPFGVVAGANAVG